MAAITKIEFWSDVGFIDGAVEIPRLNAPDPTNPTVTIEPDEPILPSKDRFFSELKLKEYYTGLLTMSYMRVTYDLKNSLGVDTPNVFYGWVDSVKLSSDGELPMTVISWHIDEWRTWKSAVTFGSGHVKRRPFTDLATTPIQNYPVRYTKFDGVDQKVGYTVKNTATPAHDIWWVIVSYNAQENGKTYIRVRTFPLVHDTGLIQIRIWVSGTQYDKFAPTFGMIYLGYFDEIFGIDPDDINGVWISPIPPFKIGSCTGTGDIGDPLIIIPEGLLQNTGEIASGNASYGWIVTTPGYCKYPQEVFNPPLVSNEERSYILTSPDGIKMMELPYGFEVSTLDVTWCMEPDGPYFEFTFRDGSYGNTEGLTVNIPLQSFPVNTNAYSSYLYSGQREYDKEARVIASNANAWKTSAGGAGSGAMMGAFGPAGLAIGAVGGTTGGLVSYGVEMLYQNDEEQRILDRLKANQSSSLIISGNAILSFMRNYGFAICSIVPDDYSEDQLNATRSQFGISVDELMPSCDSLIRSTSPIGYYNIQNMIVNGNVPVSAKKWIREKFRSGVRLI